MAQVPTCLGNILKSRISGCYRVNCTKVQTKEAYFLDELINLSELFILLAGRELDLSYKLICSLAPNLTLNTSSEAQAVKWR